MTSEITPRAALSAIGVAWRAWSVQTPSELMHPSLVRTGRRWVCVSDPAMFAGGLTTSEALGLSLAVAWKEADSHAPIIQPKHGQWRITLPTSISADMQPAAALPLARALLLVRRLLWPTRPFGPRDLDAEGIQLHVRAMEAQLAPARPVEILTPELIHSDLGRDWGGRYTSSG